MTWPFSKKIINSKFYKGGNTTKSEPSSEDELMSLEVPKIEEKINAIQLEYTEKMIVLAKTKGIDVVYIETPKYGTVAENERYLNMMKNYAKILENEHIKYILCEKTWNAIGSPKEIAHYTFDHFDAKYFVDTGHLSYEGRVLFSENILNY